MIKKECGDNNDTVTQFMAMRDKFAQNRAATEAKAEAAVAAEEAKSWSLNGAKASNGDAAALADGDLGEYKRLRAELGGNDETVTKYLAAREKMVKAKADALVSPELARAEALMKGQDLDLSFTVSLG